MRLVVAENAMPHSQNRVSLKRALCASGLLHVLLAPLLVAGTMLGFGALSRDAAGPIETTHVSYLNLERARRRPRRVAVTRKSVAARVVRPARAVAHPAPRVAVATQRAHEAPRTPSLPPSGPATVAGAAAGGEVAAERTSQTVAQRLESQETLPAGGSTVEVAPTETPTEMPAPIATPVPARVVEASAHGVEVPPGGWGQSFEKPLVADETALADLRARYHAASAVTIEVDETGHAIRISLPAGLAEDARAELEKRLRDLRYVPAECNGLRCTGTLQILI
jgi:hypothetical protein